MAAPFEYVIVGFPENNFSGEIADGLAALLDAGLIRIVDLVLVAKGDDGSVVVLEVDEHEHGGMIGPEDIEHAAESIADGSSVLILVWEDLWAKPLAEAIRRAGGELIEGGIIPADLGKALETALAEAG